MAPPVLVNFGLASLIGADESTPGNRATSQYELLDDGHLWPRLCRPWARSQVGYLRYSGPYLKLLAKVTVDPKPKSAWSSLLLLFEISRIRRRLILAGRHQQSIAAQIVVFAADHDLPIIFITNEFGPLGA